jgi:cellulose synthase (UDP-forming)
MLIMARLKAGKEQPGRVIFLLVGAFVSLRYWVWRTTDTLFYVGFFDMIFMLLLYLAETYSLVVHFLGMFVNIWPLERKPVPLPEDSVDLPSVDVFIPTYNESEEIVKVTVIGSTQIDYPKDKLRIYILDDGSTVARRDNPKTASSAIERHDRIREMAADLGVSYLTRANNEHAKAGNINSALQQTSGELVLFLDCDHVPARDILKNTVGLFLQDKKLFVVQTPHFFINPDPVEKNLATFIDAPSENEMFYGVIQSGLDFWNSSYFCGSAAIMRRKYLEETGGIAGETITEDAETSLALHRKGYTSAYISRPMICGLSPENFDSLIIQRSRWAQGMVQVLLLGNPLFKKGLTMFQRLCYFNSCYFWFFGIARIIFYISPAAYLLFGLKVYNASVTQVLAYAVPHIISSFLINQYLYGKVRWPFFSELYESVQSIFLTPAVVSTMLHPRKPTFIVTPKGKNLESDFLSPIARPFYIMFLIILVTFPVAAVKWYLYPLYRGVITIVGLWSVFNCIIAFACLGSVWERRQVRRFHRAWAKGSLQVFFPRLNLSAVAEIKDISMSGIGFECSIPGITLHAREEVRIEGHDTSGEGYSLQAVLMRILTSGDKVYCGGEFLTPDKESFSRVVKFVYGDSQRWVDFRESRSHSIPPWKALIYFVYKGFYGFHKSLRGMLYISSMELKKYVSLLLRTPGILWQRREQQRERP